MLTNDQITHVLFDLDGTLIDTVDQLVIVVDQVVQEKSGLPINDAVKGRFLIFKHSRTEHTHSIHIRIPTQFGIIRTFEQKNQSRVGHRFRCGQVAP